MQHHAYVIFDYLLLSSYSFKVRLALAANGSLPGVQGHSETGEVCRVAGCFPGRMWGSRYNKASPFAHVCSTGFLLVIADVGKLPWKVAAELPKGSGLGSAGAPSVRLRLPAVVS